ncbi:TPA: hypothetical protein ACPHVF_002392 [Legionella anisa]
MSRYLTLSLFVKKIAIIIIILMFCGYYFLWGTLYFLITAPDLVLAMGTLVSGRFIVTAFIWGWISAVLLSLIFASGALGMEDFFKKRDWVNAVKSLTNLMLSATVMLAPVFVLKNIALKQAYSPFVLSVLVVVFLIVVTAAYCRQKTVTKEIQHVA